MTKQMKKLFTKTIPRQRFLDYQEMQGWLIEQVQGYTVQRVGNGVIVYNHAHDFVLYDIVEHNHYYNHKYKCIGLRYRTI